jgi:hypothetical protein
MRLVRLTPVVVFALAACVAPVPSVSPVVSPTPTTSPTPTVTPIPASIAGLALYRAPGFTFTYPADWHTVDVTDVVTLGGSSSFAVLANYPLTGCPALDINCLFALKVPQGGLLVSVGGAHNFASIFDPSEHWSETIDAMPARTTSQPGYLGIDENRAWIVAQPGGIWGQLGVEASIRGPGLAALDAELDALARSIRFEVHPTPLAPSAAGEALAAGVRYVDKLGTGDLPVPYTCFPITGGERQLRLRTWWGIALRTAVSVTCATAIEATSVDLWRVSLSVRWAAGPHRVAGVWREDVYFDAHGVWIGRVLLTPNASPLNAVAPSPNP